MTITLNEVDSATVAALLGRLRGMAAARAVVAPHPEFARAAHAEMAVIAGVEAVLRACEDGLGEDERRRRNLAVQVIEEQLAAFGADRAR